MLLSVYVLELLEPGSALLLDSGGGGGSLDPGSAALLDSMGGGGSLDPGSAALLDSGTMFELEDSFSLFEDAGTELDSGTTLELDSSALAELEDFSPSDEEYTESVTSRESSANSHANEESTIQVPELTSQKTPALRSFTQYSSPETDFSHFGKSFSESTPFSSFFCGTGRIVRAGKSKQNASRAKKKVFFHTKFSVL